MTTSLKPQVKMIQKTIKKKSTQTQQWMVGLTIKQRKINKQMMTQTVTQKRRRTARIANNKMTKSYLWAPLLKYPTPC